MAARAFRNFGFRPYIPVKEQQLPDPEFPTVVFPNPEEKGEFFLLRRIVNSPLIIGALVRCLDEVVSPC